MQQHHIEDFHNGWFIGDFAPSLLKNKEFEVALKVHHQNEYIPKHKHDKAIEINLCILGQMHVNGKVINKGDIFIFEKGEVCDVKILSKLAEVICIKSPSVPSDKIICE